MLRLTVEALDLGPDVRAVGLELTDDETEEPVTGPDAARIWALALTRLAGEQPSVLDFFAHLDRIRQFCGENDIRFRDTPADGLAVTESDPDGIARLLERFEGETFGARAGAPIETGDDELERAIRQRGFDAYHQAYPRYLYCAICEPETGSLTIVSDELWASEVARRLRAALKPLPVSVEMLM
jgi:hypothetical protein